MRSLEVLDRSPYPLVDAFAELERPNSITKKIIEFWGSR